MVQFTPFAVAHITRFTPSVEVELISPETKRSPGHRRPVRSSATLLDGQNRRMPLVTRQPGIENVHIVDRIVIGLTYANDAEALPTPLELGCQLYRLHSVRNPQLRPDPTTKNHHQLAMLWLGGQSDQDCPVRLRRLTQAPLRRCQSQRRLQLPPQSRCSLKIQRRGCIL